MYKANFCAGPSKLPNEIYQKLSEMVLDYENSGLSILSVSHRGSQFIRVLSSIKKGLRSLLNIGEDYEILLMHGGASAQFSALPLNFKAIGKAAYFDSGQWARAAIKEAQKFTCVDIFSVGESIIDNYDYVHYTENETVDGFQWDSVPVCESPLIADMSSSFLSQAVDVNQHDLIYAGAQKNFGLPGVVVVIVKKALIVNGSQQKNVPSILDYALNAKADSLKNTPNAIAWVCIDLILQALIEKGGLAVVEKENELKARALYDCIDQSNLYQNHVAIEHRSRVNVTFTLPSQALTDQFLLYVDQKGLYGLKGHRSVGGVRASLYNAVTQKDVELLVQTMKEFEVGV